MKYPKSIFIFALAIIGFLIVLMPSIGDAQIVANSLTLMRDANGTCINYNPDPLSDTGAIKLTPEHIDTCMGPFFDMCVYSATDQGLPTDFSIGISSDIPGILDIFGTNGAGVTPLGSTYSACISLDQAETPQPVAYEVGPLHLMRYSEAIGIGLQAYAATTPGAELGFIGDCDNTGVYNTSNPSYNVWEQVIFDVHPSCELAVDDYLASCAGDFACEYQRHIDIEMSAVPAVSAECIKIDSIAPVVKSLGCTAVNTYGVTPPDLTENTIAPTASFAKSAIKTGSRRHRGR